MMVHSYRKPTRLLAAALLLILHWHVGLVATQPNQPNILLIFIDDLGFGELGCQGNHQIPTPHIDALARHGVRFTSGYVTASYCSPLRGGKGNLYEGGIRVPFLVQWKGRLPAGRVYVHPVISLDVFATASNAAGIALPSAPRCIEAAIRTL